MADDLRDDALETDLSNVCLALTANRETVALEAFYRMSTRLRASEAATAAAVERAKRSEYALTECRPFIERYSDVRDGDYGGVEPNEAMQLVYAIDQALPPVAEEAHD